MTKLFSKLEIITIIHQPEWPKKLFTALCSSLPGIDWREGTSQIVKCVGVETPHCGDVEMWWIHIVKMWRCGGSTFYVWWSTYNSYLSKNERKSPLF